MTSIPNSFSKWPGFMQRVWMKAHPGVTVRDHRNNTHVHSHRGHHALGHGHRGVRQILMARHPHVEGHGHGHTRGPNSHDQTEAYRPDQFGPTNDRGRAPSDSRFQRMLDSGNIEALLNSPGAGEWLKKPENNLKVMMAIQSENRLFTLLTNVLTTKHKTAMAAINNTRV